MHPALIPERQLAIDGLAGHPAHQRRRDLNATRKIQTSTSPIPSSEASCSEDGLYKERRSNKIHPTFSTQKKKSLS
ncbi:hypothetical protein ACRALDRAFT_2015629 [Sodiomyces alcalophilus JCM 7366]|uniref:uncharacterized protein n=1 Tax=Sodiomyces alcalophilus JCM 7366 TaxID=591952 RepID=UPI0039B67457